MHFGSLDSSSDEASRQLREGRPLPFSIVCDHQTSGRGRNGRAWVSRRGVGLYLTHARGVETLPKPLTLAPLAVGCALADWLRGLGLDVRLKWPNDLRVDGAKIGGILCELRNQTLFVGLGINWLEAPLISDQKTAAAAQYSAVLPTLESAQFAAERALRSGLDWWAAQGNDALRQRWWQLAERGQMSSGSMQGEALGLADDGALRLLDASGAVHELRAGDVETL
jgi:BirA family biotin operon repressor/biotin-[acetyl-CoA-carboxylase] ligase